MTLPYPFINKYLLNIRITHAKRLLRFTDKSSEEIAHEVGFHELYYFSRVFLKVEGCSISEYRKMWGHKSHIFFGFSIVDHPHKNRTFRPHYTGQNVQADPLVDIHN